MSSRRSSRASSLQIRLSHPVIRTFVLGMVLLGILVALLLVGPRITGQVYYYDYGASGFGYGPGYFGGTFTTVYYQYGYIIDALVFLLIFLSVGKLVFTKHFGEHSKPLYVGVGLFLAFALLLWEERTGIYLLEFAGPFAALMIPIVVLGVIYVALRKSGVNFFFALFLTIIGVVALLYGLRLTALQTYYNVINFLYNFWYPLGATFDCLAGGPRSNCGIGSLIVIIGVGALAVFLVVRRIWAGPPQRR